LAPGAAASAAASDTAAKPVMNMMGFPGRF
jgi:hypothetical protein